MYDMIFVYVVLEVKLERFRAVLGTIVYNSRLCSALVRICVVRVFDNV